MAKKDPVADMVQMIKDIQNKMGKRPDTISMPRENYEVIKRWTFMFVYTRPYAPVGL